MNYEEMSDFEVNVSIAEIFGIYWNISPDKSESGQWEYCKDADICNKNAGALTVTLPDYCNNPSDAWPIILVNRINVYASEGPDFMPWMAGCGGMMVSNKNPLRAAMIVFLMMQEQAK